MLSTSLIGASSLGYISIAELERLYQLELDCLIAAVREL